MSCCVGRAPVNSPTVSTQLCMCIYFVLCINKAFSLNYHVPRKGFLCVCVCACVCVCLCVCMYCVSPAFHLHSLTDSWVCVPPCPVWGKSLTLACPLTIPLLSPQLN